MPIPAWAPYAAGAVGALFKTGSDIHQVNRMNRFNAREAAKQRGFAERMRNTQWQAAVEDMRAAGINPALAHSSGPNAAPGGSSASGGAASATDPVASALAVKAQHKQLSIMESQRNLLDAQASHERTKAQVTAHSERMMSAEMGRYFKRDESGRYTMTPALMEWLRKEHEGRMAASQTQIQQLRNLVLTESELKAIAGVFDAVGTSGKAAQLILPLLIAAGRR